MKFRVSFSAVYDVTAEVEAESEAQAIAAVQNDDWFEIVAELFDRPHPDTEFFIETK